MSSFPGPRTPGESSTVGKEMERSFEKRTNAFNEFAVRELPTQWKHKIGVVPEAAGITTRWWDYTAGVVRDGPSALVLAGEDISTNESGEYNVGDPALAGAGVMFGDPDPVDGAGDDWWTGYTNRLEPGVTNPDGGGIGVKYFDVGEGDLGGATTAGPQEYVWFDSGVDGVPDLVVPKERWDNPNVATNFFRDGGFIRTPHTYYDEGYFRLNWNVKTETGYDIKTLHTFVVQEDPMWLRSDLKWQMATEGSNVEGRIDAAHYKAGTVGGSIRSSFEARDGTVAGDAVSLSQGTPVPLISVVLRDGWENVNLKPVSLSVDLNDSYYVFISVGGSLVDENFTAPGSDFTGVSPGSAEYAANSDNEATAFDSDDVGEVGYGKFIPSGGFFDTSNVADDIEDFALATGDIATLGVIPVDATTFNGASLRWGGNF